MLALDLVVLEVVEVVVMLLGVEQRQRMTQLRR